MRNLRCTVFCLLVLVIGTFLFAGELTGVFDCKDYKKSSSSDTILIFISNAGTPSYIDTLFFEAGDWQNIEFDISGFERDSIRSITFGPYHHNLDTGGFYLKEIALYGSDTQVIEDFACYDPDTIDGPGMKIVTSDRYWHGTYVYDGSQIFAIIMQGAFNYMHCYYFGRLKKVGCTLHLFFSPNTRNWSQYNTICFTVCSDMPTGIIPQKKHSDIPDMIVHKHRGKGLYITLPTKCESADFYLYTVSGKLVRQKSYKRNGPFFWQLPFIPNGAYIVTVNDGVNTYSDVITIEK